MHQLPRGNAAGLGQPAASVVAEAIEIPAACLALPKCNRRGRSDLPGSQDGNSDSTTTALVLRYMISSNEIHMNQ